MPATYYCTHALAPLMYITDTRPVKNLKFTGLTQNLGQL
jgi:hypothetical protein